MREFARAHDKIRNVEIKTNVQVHADGSCLIKLGRTHVLCSANINDNLPRFLKGQGQGWVTAEYGMLPGSTHSRIEREAVKGKQSGRTQEIQRLIGRSLRSVVDLKKLGEKQIIIDCDVIQADGGTRTASITGGYVALALALRKLSKSPLIGQVSAISCGIVGGELMVDLDYNEDSTAETDANFVIGLDGKIIEAQATAENKFFTSKQLFSMIDLANNACAQLFELQNKALGN